jgi:secreted PhoX family phosphatase
MFGCPDGLAFDAAGCCGSRPMPMRRRCTRASSRRIGNNQMLACDLASGEIRRFLTGPTNCEVTGATWTPDGTTLFINIQHPGETPSDRSDPAEPGKFSTWPDYRPGARPRSATVAIRRQDGGVIGT